MTLQEILNSIMKKYPHSYSNADTIGMINDIQKRLFRTIYKIETTTTYDIIAENPFYPLDYSPQNIIEVVVNDEEYPYQNIKSRAAGNYYYITEDNSLGIYPTPAESTTNGLTVFHHKEPYELTTIDLGAEPDFDKAWHMMIVYAVCKELAENSLDGNMVKVFVSQYNGLEREFKGYKPARFEPIDDVYGRGDPY